MATDTKQNGTLQGLAAGFGLGLVLGAVAAAIGWFIHVVNKQGVGFNLNVNFGGESGDGVTDTDKVEGGGIRNLPVAYQNGYMSGESMGRNIGEMLDLSDMSEAEVFDMINTYTGSQVVDPTDEAYPDPVVSDNKTRGVVLGEDEYDTWESWHVSSMPDGEGEGRS